MSQSLLQRTLEDYKIHHSSHRTTYTLPVFILKELGITRWSRQRPPAQERVDEIAAWIREHQCVVGILSLAWHPTERLVCYDGQHRLHALFQQENVDITDYVTTLATTYKPFLSTSAKPCRPNFNRDALGEALYHLWRDDLQEAVPFQRIITGLTQVNEMYDKIDWSSPRMKTVKKYPGIHKKCSQHSFWLMAETGHLPVEDLKRFL